MLMYLDSKLLIGNARIRCEVVGALDGTHIRMSVRLEVEIEAVKLQQMSLEWLHQSYNLSMYFLVLSAGKDPLQMGES